MDNWVILLIIFIISVLIVLIIHYKPNTNIIEDYPEYKNGLLHDNIYVEGILKSPVFAKKAYEHIKQLDSIIVYKKSDRFEHVLRELSMSGVAISKIVLKYENDESIIAIHLVDYFYIIQVVFSGVLYQYLKIDSLQFVKNIESFTAFISLRGKFDKVFKDLGVDIDFEANYYFRKNSEFKMVFEPIVVKDNYYLHVQICSYNRIDELIYQNNILYIGTQMVRNFNTPIITGVNEDLLVEELKTYIKLNIDNK